jgi:Putative adhesin
MHKICLQLFLAVFALTTITVTARADDWSKTYELTGKPELRVATREANVHIEVWEQNKIEARVTTQGWHIGSGTGGVQIVEHQQGNTVEFELRQPHRLHFSMSSDTHRIDLEIHMPRSAKVNVQTGDGNVSAKGLEGDLDFTTADGQLDLENVDGALRLHTSDGAARVSGRFDALELRTSDGQVEVEAQRGSQLRGAWDVRSSDGNVRLKVPEDLAADVELRASDGSITTNIPLVVEGNFSRHEIHGKMNGGGNLLTVRTSDGSVTLDKS